MGNSTNLVQQASRDDIIREHLKNAPASVLMAELVELTDATGERIPKSAVRASLKRLMDAGQAFTAGNTRSTRYGSTQQKANLEPSAQGQAAAA